MFWAKKFVTFYCNNILHSVMYALTSFSNSILRSLHRYIFYYFLYLPPFSVVWRRFWRVSTVVAAPPFGVGVAASVVAVVVVMWVEKVVGRTLKFKEKVLRLSFEKIARGKGRKEILKIFNFANKLWMPKSFSKKLCVMGSLNSQEVNTQLSEGSPRNRPDSNIREWQRPKRLVSKFTSNLLKSFNDKWEQFRIAKSSTFPILFPLIKLFSSPYSTKKDW